MPEPHQRRRITLIGGGTGAPELLLAMRARMPQEEFAVVVPVTDTGRSTGATRRLFGIPGVGDVRHAVSTLSDPGSQVAKISELRLTCEADAQLDGMAVGNLVLASLIQEFGNLGSASEEFARLVGARSAVLPVSVDDIHLRATLADGSEVVGEYEVRQLNKPRITNLAIEGSLGSIWATTRVALLNSDIVIIGPGSLWTSIAAVLVVPGVWKAIAESQADVIFVCNTTTQPGQTDGLSFADHVDVIGQLLLRPPDAVVANIGRLSVQQEAALEQNGLLLVLPGEKEAWSTDSATTKLISRDLLDHDRREPLWNKLHTAYHDMQVVASTVIEYIERTEATVIR